MVATSYLGEHGRCGRGLAAGIMCHPQFRPGFKQTAARGLVFDTAVFHHQLPEVASLADDVPDTTIVLNHIGQGKILYFGSSNFAGWHIARAQEAAQARHFLGLIGEQSKYNLVTRDVERELLPAVADYGLGVMVWSPLQRGLLGGILALENEGGLRGHRVDAEALARYRPQLTRYEALCAELGLPPAHVALAWLLSRPGVTSPIIGPVTVDQLGDVVRCLEVRLDDEVLARLDDIFPGYRPAPEDYAW